MPSLRLTLALAAVVAFPDGIAAEWHEYRTTNFLAYSDQQPKRAREILSRLEVFRRVVFLITGLTEFPEDNRLVVVLFADDELFEKISPDGDYAGFYLPTKAGPRMIVGPYRADRNRAHVLFHEYVHHLFRRYSQFDYPRWYAEGFAEFLANTDIEKHNIKVGAVPQAYENALPYLAPVKIESVLALSDQIGSGRAAGHFYYTSWLLTHYLQMRGSEKKSTYKAQLANYIVAYNNGTPSLEAFQSNFEESLQVLNRRLDRYRRYTSRPIFTLNKIEYEGEFSQRKLTPGEAAWVTADIGFRLDNYGAALDLLSAMDPEDTDSARALALRSVIDDRHGEEFADELARNAVALEENDSYVFSYTMQQALNRYYRSADAGSPDTKQLEAALSYGERATALDPNNQEAHFYLWHARDAAGEKKPAARSMMAAFHLDPSSVELNYEIGAYLHAEGYSKPARPFLERVRNWAHSESQRAEVAALLDAMIEEMAAPSDQQEN